jgi:hypothetical protein
VDCIFFIEVRGVRSEPPAEPPCSSLEGEAIYVKVAVVGVNGRRVWVSARICLISAAERVPWTREVLTPAFSRMRCLAGEYAGFALAVAAMRH